PSMHVQEHLAHTTEEAMPDDNPAAIAEDARRYWLDEGYSPGGVIREVDYERTFTGLHPMLAGIKVVDCDTHFTEPPDLFTSRAPAKFKGNVTYFKHLNGCDRWY